jgi:hypothetical protein
MEIINTNQFSVDLPPEKENMYYLYMTEDPRMRYKIYFCLSPDDQNNAAKYLSSFNMPMKCIQLKATENEAIAYREKLEKEREAEWYKWAKENKLDGVTQNG